MLTDADKEALAKRLAFEALKQADMLKTSYSLDEAEKLGLVPDDLTDEELQYIEAAYDQEIAKLLEEKLP